MNTNDNLRLGTAIAEYLQAVERGEAPDRKALLLRHPDLADELAGYFSDFDRMQKMAAPLHLSEPDATLPPLDPNATISQPAASVDPLARIRYFGDYELLCELARGGMGVVYKAKQVSLNRVIALKMILSGQLASDADVARFHAEAESAASLDHPNILPIYEVGEHQGQHYFAMKLVTGGSLAGAVPELMKHPKRAAAIVAKVSRAVHFAHQRGILHRDLKPANVLLDNDGTPYVTDFGLAKKVEGDSGLTQSGAIIGTPSYMAPEQARAEKQLTTGVDVYSLGAILYELVAGRPPFRATTVMDTLMQVLDRDPPDPRTANPHADRDLAVIALRCLEKLPARRYESASALADDLDRWADGKPIHARPVTRRERTSKWIRRNPVVAAMAMSLVTAASIAVASTWIGYNQTRLALESAETQLHVSKMILADRELSMGNFEAAEALLKFDPVDRHDWEWHYLHHRLNPETRMIRSPNGGSFEELALFDNGRSLVVGMLGKPSYPVAVFQADTGEWTPQLKADLGAVDPRDTAPARHLAAHPNGLVVASMMQPDLLIWQPDGRQITVHSTARIESLAISPDGRWIFSGEEDGLVRMWDATSGRLEHILKGHTHGVRACSCRPGSAEVATCSFVEVIIWNIETRKEVRRLIPQTDPRAQGSGVASGGLAYAPDGKTLAVGTWEGIERYDTTKWSPIGRLEIPDHLARNQARKAPFLGYHIAFRSDNRYLAATSSNNSEVHVWDYVSGSWLTQLKGHQSTVNGMVFSPSGQLITSSADATIRFWDVPLRPYPVDLFRHPTDITALIFSPDGSVIASGDSRGNVRVSDAFSGVERFTRTGTPGLRTTKLDVSADGRWLAVAETVPAVFGRGKGNSAQLRIWDLATGENGPILQVPQSPNGFPGISFDPSGDRLAVAMGSDGVDLYSLADGQLSRSYHFPADDSSAPHEAWDVAFSPDGMQIAAPDYWRGQVTLWNTNTGKVSQTLTRPGMIHAYSTQVAISPDGRFISHNLATELWTWDLRTGKAVSGTSASNHLAFVFHPGGRRLFDSDYTRADLLDVQSGQMVLRLPETNCQAAAFSRDGHRLAVANGDAVKVYDAAPKEGFSFGGGRGPGAIWIEPERSSLGQFFRVVLAVAFVLLVLFAAKSIRTRRRLNLASRTDTKKDLSESPPQNSEGKKDHFKRGLMSTILDPIMEALAGFWWGKAIIAGLLFAFAGFMAFVVPQGGRIDVCSWGIGAFVAGLGVYFIIRAIRQFRRERPSQ